MKKILSHYIPIALMALLVNGMTDFANFTFSPSASLVSIAEASGDKDKDEDSDDVADCKDNTGICSNKGTVTVTGMTNEVNVRSGSGSVLLDVTSSDVDLQSKSADLTGRGLNGKGKFKTDTGNVRVKYCKKLQDVGNKSLDVKINQSATGVDDDGDEIGSDANLQFPVDSTVNISITFDTDLYKSDFTHCSSCDFELKGSVALGYLVLSEYNLPTPACPY